MISQSDIERVLDGDRDAAELLARHACTLALRTAAAILRDRNEAGDVAQDVAVDVLRSLRALRDPNAFDAWVHRITVRHTLRRLRRSRRAQAAETPLVLVPDGEHPMTGDGLDPDTLIAARAALKEALRELTPRQRVAMALRYVHDLSDEEIARALGCRAGTVHALLSRGRAALRRDERLAALAVEFSTGGSR